MATVTEQANIIFNYKQTGDGAEKAASGLEKVVKAAKLLAGAAVAQQIVKATVELGKLGVASQAAAQRFDAFAGSSEQAEKFLTAFNKGTQGTVDRVQAMTSASKLLQMGLVETGSEMTQIAAMATKLGDQTMAAGDRINDFALMLANTSIPRLDNFGISSGRVRERMKELQAAGVALNREEAFKMAVMEEGADALERLGDVTQTTAHQLDVGKAAWADMKTSMGEMVLAAGEMTGALEGIPRRLRAMADLYQEVGKHGASAQGVFAAWGAIFNKNETWAEAYTRKLRELNQETIDAAEGQRFLSGEYERTAPPQRELIRLTDDSATAHNQYQAALLETERAQDAAARSTLEMQRAEEEAMRVTQEHEQYLFQASISFTDFYRRRQETAADYNQQIADAEERHRDRLTQLTEEGNADMIAEENARYEEEMAMLEASRQEQEAEQRRSLGRMVLQHFEAWAEMTGLTASETLKMQTDIAQKYGLIDSTAAQHLNNMERNWGNTLAVMRGDADSFFSAFLAGFNSLPDSHIIRIRYDMARPPSDIPRGDTNPNVPPADGGGGTAPPADPNPSPVNPPSSGGGGTRRGGDVQVAGGLPVGVAPAELFTGLEPGPGWTPPGTQPSPGAWPGPGAQPWIPPYTPGLLPPGSGLPPGVQPGIIPPYLPPGVQPKPILPPWEDPYKGYDRSGSMILPGRADWGGAPPQAPSAGGKGGTGGGGGYAGCNIVINVYTNDPMEVARELEKYMRLRGASSTSTVGH